MKKKKIDNIIINNNNNNNNNNMEENKTNKINLKIDTQLNNDSPNSTRSKSDSYEKTPDSTYIMTPNSKTFKKKPKSYIKKIKSSPNFQSVPLTKSISNLSVSSLNKFNNLNNLIEESNNNLDSFEINDNLGFDLEDNNNFTSLLTNFNEHNEKSDNNFPDGKIEEKDFFDEIEKNSFSQPKVFLIKKHNKKKDIVKVIDNNNNEEDNESIIASSINSSKSGKNQLFQIVPPLELVNEIMKIFLGENISNPNYQFTRKMMEERKIVDKINNYIPELRKYYLKCKQNKYLDNLDCKKCITIFRQLIRIYGYQIHSTEKYQNGSKFLLYKIQNNVNQKNNQKKNNFTIDFD